MISILIYFIGAALCFFIGYLLFISNRLKQYRSLLPEASRDVKYERAQFDRFARALSGACTGLGIPPAGLFVIDFPTPNALALKVEGEAAVAVTREMLEAGLSNTEIEAVMTHEACRIVTRDLFSTTWLADPRWLFSALAFVVLVPLVIGATRWYPGAYIVMGALAGFMYSTMIVSFLYISRMRRTWDQRLGNTDLPSTASAFFRAGTILADSLASKTTGQPESMRTAIQKISEVVVSREHNPCQYYTFDRLFVPIFQTMKPAFGGLAFDTVGPSAAGTRERDAALHRGFVATRLENLILIQRGTWNAFEEVTHRADPARRLAIKRGGRCGRPDCLSVLPL
jgi:Zn-dependent protease with chaperone function